MKKIFDLYKVGGSVRDKLLGIEKIKDIDFTFVFEKTFIEINSTNSSERFFNKMVDILKESGFEIFLSTPDCFTARARFPKGHKNEGMTADFVMARKEISYDDNSRKPKIVPGSLFDDLERRDFTVNALAEDEDGNIIDFFGGQEDLEKGLLRTPIEPIRSFMDDPLRVLRMWRFAVTKGFVIEEETERAALSAPVWTKFEKVVSKERVREELFKMFEYSTLGSLILFRSLPPDILFKLFKDNKLFLKPTLK